VRADIAVPIVLDARRALLVRHQRERLRRVQLIDFETQARSTFHVTREWKLKPPASKGNRADVMFLIPATTVEHKNPNDGEPTRSWLQASE
jgi:type I restriction enzyme R subunit